MVHLTKQKEIKLVEDKKEEKDSIELRDQNKMDAQQLAIKMGVSEKEAKEILKRERKQYNPWTKNYPSSMLFGLTNKIRIIK